MRFDFENSKIYPAVRCAKVFPLSLLKFYRSAAIIITVLAVLGWITTRLLEMDFYFSQASYRGFACIGFSLSLSIIFFEIFNYYYLRYPPKTVTDNIADWLGFGPAHILENAKLISVQLGENEVSPKSILVALLTDRSLEEALIRIPSLIGARAHLQKQMVGPKLSRRLSQKSQNFSQESIDLISNSLRFMKTRGGQKISSLDLLVAFFDADQQFKEVILNSDLGKEDLMELAYWYERIWSYRQAHKKFWSLNNLYRKPPLGRDWIYGFFPYLNAFASNLTSKFKYIPLPFKLASRSTEISRIEEILVRAGENNVLLVGPEGVGKNTVIEEFAEMIAHGRALPALNYKNVFHLNLAMVVSAAKTVGEIQNIILSIFNEAAGAGNVIIVINDIHNYVGDVEGLGHINITEIMTPYLKSARVQLIATTDLTSYHRFIESHSGLGAVFERVDINEPDQTQTLRILEEIVPSVENRSGVIVSYAALKSIVESADKFLTASPFPEKAVNLLSEVVAHVVSSGLGRVINEDHVNEVITRKTGVPLGRVADSEKEKLANFEKLMHRELVGQDRAVEVVSAALRRLRAGLSKRGRPAGVFIFVGPTGVGKTQTAKILARTYFGSEDKMIRFDMSEFQGLDAIDRFIGNSRTNEPGQFVTAVQDNPFSLILLDEIEKANRELLNIFLQVFDEGHLTDVFGRKISFEQNIIIATSNAGSSSIRDMVNQNIDPAKEKNTIINIIIQQGHFLPEFLNRFDEVVIFHPLSGGQIRQISTILLKQLSERLLNKGYIFQPTKELADFIAKEGFDPQFGARPMQRVISDKVENTIAKKILNGELEKGVAFSISLEDLK